MVPQLSRYQVLGRLATGGMAEVWLARSVGVGGFEKLVVVKTILKNLAENQTFVQMFIQEARVAAMLNHPNCVQIFDCGQEGPTLYIAMEYIDGFSLSRVLQRAKEQNKRVPVEVISRIFMDASTGLDYAHRLTDREGRKVNLVHRDVSPDNLIISFSGQTKLVDFGVAKAQMPSMMQATRFGVVKGKFGYIAPEYLRGEKIDGRADVFALGVSLYRALTGRRPFTGANEAAITMSVLNDPPKNPLEHVPELNPALAAVVMMSLEKDPSVRFESARAMRQAIEAATKPCEPETVGDYVNELWPPGDKERIAMERLARGVLEETSSPALASIISGGYDIPGRVTPSKFGDAAELTKAVPAPPGTFPGPPAPVAPLAGDVSAAPTEHVGAVDAGLAPKPRPSGPKPAVVQLPPDDDEDERPRSSKVWVLLLFAAIAAGGVFYWRYTKQRLPGVSDSFWILPQPSQKTPEPPKPATPEAAKTAEPTPAPLPEGSPHLSVKTDPPVTVTDGKKTLGISPLEIDLEAGSHALHLVNKGAGVDQLLTLELKPGEKFELKELAKGTLVLKVTPWAYVKLDGRNLGQTPIEPRALFEGTHVLELNNTESNEHRRIEVKVKGGETKALNVNLDTDEE
ncbi:MAG: protein kinase [Myxococcaceae bacterium]